jgi:hypothetical protein
VVLNWRIRNRNRHLPVSCVAQSQPQSQPEAMSEKAGFADAELRKFADAGTAIVRATGATFEQWAEGEMGLILKGTAGAIAAQTPAKAELRARVKALKNFGLTKGDVTINAGLRGEEGRVWVRTRKKKWSLAGTIGHNAGAFRPENKHFTDDTWRDVEGGVSDYQSQAGIIAIAKRTVGLARQSVIQMADAVGILLERVAGGNGLSARDLGQARSAVASDGKTYLNGFGTRLKTAEGFSIEVINRYPNLHAAKIDIALATAIGERTGYMQQVLRERLGKSAEQVAKAFPYLQVR